MQRVFLSDCPSCLLTSLACAGSVPFIEHGSIVVHHAEHVELPIRTAREAVLREMATTVHQEWLSFYQVQFIADVAVSRGWQAMINFDPIRGPFRSDWYDLGIFNDGIALMPNENELAASLDAMAGSVVSFIRYQLHVPACIRERVSRCL